MKKFILSLIMVAMLAPTSTTFLVARGGDAAAGVAAGLIGGAMLTGIASHSSNRHSRRAEERAVRAEEKVDDLRREQQQEKIDALRQMIREEQIKTHSGNTTQLLIIALALLFLAVIGLGVLVLKKR